MTLRIGTRGSRLALAQAREVADALTVTGIETELVTITTAGDRGADPASDPAGVKGLFVTEIVRALLDEEIDLAVHSAKDLPAGDDEGVVIAAVPERSSALDVLVTRDGDLPPGARVGTSSIRRQAQVFRWRPDVLVKDLRGNVDTRLRKLAAGEVEVLVLAAAGLDRLDRRGEAGGTLFGDVFVPAPGQGVIAVQAREGSPAADVAASVSHGRTMACLRAERAAVRELAASCHTPVGVHADGVTIRGFAGLPDGSEWIVDEVPMDGDDAAPGLARRMLAAGAADLLRAAEAMAAR